MNAQLPVIREIHEAESDRERASILLRVPDTVLMKYREVFEAACRRVGFDTGLEFINWRRAGWSAVRQADGSPRSDFEKVRRAFAAFASGERP